MVNQVGLGAFRSFSCRFPFSWLVKEKIDQIMAATANSSINKGKLAFPWLQGYLMFVHVLVYSVVIVFLSGLGVGMVLENGFPTV